MYNCDKKASKNIGIALLLGLFSQSSFAIQEGWYLGGGVGATHLDPKVPVELSLVSENQSELAKVIVGYDLDQLGSIEFSVSDLGEAELTNADTVTYSAANIAGLYRLYDSQSSPYSNQTWGVNLYAKLGLGYLKLDSETTIESESRVNLLVGAGAEFAMIGGFALRTEFEFIDADALAVSVSVLKRFRFEKKQPNSIFNNSKPLPRYEEPTTPQLPNQSSVEPAVSTPKLVQVVVPSPIKNVQVNPDADADGVADIGDNCPDSKAGYPVRVNGCGSLNGVLSNLKFAKFSSDLTTQTKDGLRSLASLLNKYPNAVVRMGSHTTNEGSAASQLALTRDRIRTIAVYLRGLGVSSGRIKFMAFGATAPFKGRATDRIDIKELY